MSHNTPELVEMMPVASQAVRDEMDQSTRSQTIGAMLSRAALVGACIGVMIIGLWENVERFGEPDSLATQTTLESTISSDRPINLTPDFVNYSQRGDRLNSIAVTAPITDIASR